MEQVKVIDDNLESLLWRLRMINNAKHRIFMSTFIMKADNSGKDIIAALVKAAERGVEEYILIDAVGSATKCKHSGEIKYLASFKNVKFCVYNPVFFSNPLRITFRMHDKILLIDDEIYMIGGRNVIDVSIGNYVDRYNLDRDVVVFPGDTGNRGSAASICSYIAVMKTDKAIKERPKKLNSESAKKIGEQLSERFEKLCIQYPFIKKSPLYSNDEEYLTADEITLITGDPQYRYKGLEIYSRLVRLMEKGEDVVVQTPYIMCNKLMYQGLTEVNKAVKSFYILTNAPEIGSNYLGCVDYMNQKNKIYRFGIRVYECLANQSIHTKSILIDDDISIIGSFNFDTRSAYMDTELMLMIRSKELNSLLKKEVEDFRLCSRYKDENGQMVYGSRYTHKKMSILRAVPFAFLRVMERPFRFLL